MDVWIVVAILTDLVDVIRQLKVGVYGACARASTLVLVHVGGGDGALKFAF